MCGIAGRWASRGGGDEELFAVGARMAGALEHRGPDDHGVWTDPAAGVVLAFRRLAIIDLSQQGHQPMRSASGRFTIVFNGEVYNFGDLRRELEGTGARFRGHSDTEVILAAFERWGIAPAVRRFVGMFALAVWDAEARTLSLVRDRLGIKPLYVSTGRGMVGFGSELKALVAGDTFERTVDRSSVLQYLRYLYVPGPHSIYRDVLKLQPGSILTIRDPAAPLPAPEPYWRVADAAAQGVASGRSLDADEAIRRLDALLRDAVSLRMIADVPLGALLSGGVDSSTIVALMQAQSPRPVRTFTIGFDAPEHDEAGFARRVAARLGTDHTELYVTGRDALDVIPDLPRLYDEPLANPSQIPTYLVCRLARRDVTVALAGDGGDEVFAGYNRYTMGERLLRRAARVPRPARRIARLMLDRLGASRVEHLVRAVPAGRRPRLLGEKLEKVGVVLGGGSLAEMYRLLLSSWAEPAELLSPEGISPRLDAVDHAFAGGEGLELVDRMMLADQSAYLPDDLLAKVDRASMAVGLEVRVPLLDHRIVEFGWTLPSSLKVRHGTGKWILRRVLDRYLEPDLVDRPKTGFTVPISDWLRGPLRPWAEDLLDGAGRQDDGLFNREVLLKRWGDFQHKRRSPGLGFWAVVHFLAWQSQWRDSSPLRRTLSHGILAR